MNKNELLKNIRDLNKVISSTTEINSLDMIIEFFKITSILHDEIINIRFLLNHSNLTYQDRVRFFQNLDKVGRNRRAFNRSSRGEDITPNNIFLGGINGIFIQPINHIYGLKDTDPDSYRQLSYQAYDFIMSYQNVFNIDSLI